MNSVDAAAQGTEALRATQSLLANVRSNVSSYIVRGLPVAEMVADGAQFVRLSETLRDLPPSVRSVIAALGVDLADYDADVAAIHGAGELLAGLSGSDEATREATCDAILSTVRQPAVIWTE